MPRGNQFARQWRLLQFLGRPQGLAVDDAARELGCTVRTVWRDLRVLQDAGFPIYDERDGRRGLWKVETGFRDRLPIPLSLPEVVALLVSRGAVDRAGAGPFGPAVASAFGKVRALLTPKATSWSIAWGPPRSVRAQWGPSSSWVPASTWRGSSAPSPRGGHCNTSPASW